MQKKCLQKNSKNPLKTQQNPENPKNQNFQKWVFANPVLETYSDKKLP